MANSGFLRNNVNQHVVKNPRSKLMDADIVIAINSVHEALSERYSTLSFEHVKKVQLSDIVTQLKRQHPQHAGSYANVRDSSFIKPDGGFLFAVDKQGVRRLVLVSEVKRQGTNDSRALEGKPKQALGNAIERLGKNVIGLRAMCKSDGIFPFVCFGSGYDFSEDSSIIDRVITINEFFPLNTYFIRKDFLPFEPGSMFFREKPWTIEEMTQIMMKIAEESIRYWFV